MDIIHKTSKCGTMFRVFKQLIRKYFVLKDKKDEETIIDNTIIIMIEIRDKLKLEFCKIGMLKAAIELLERVLEGLKALRGIDNAGREVCKAMKKFDTNIYLKRRE